MFFPLIADGGPMIGLFREYAPQSNHRAAFVLFLRNRIGTLREYATRPDSIATGTTAAASMRLHSRFHPGVHALGLRAILRADR